MNRAVVPVAIILAANAGVLALAARERARAATATRISVCANLITGGAGNRSRPPALYLALAPDSAGTTSGLDSAGLRELGFSAPVAGKEGKLRDFDEPWPRQRPAWVRLRQSGDSLRRFQAVEVSARRERLPPDSTSIVVQGIIGFVEHIPDQEPGGGGHEHGGPRPPRVPGILRASVVQVMPRELHLDHALITQLRRAIPDRPECMATGEVVVMQGASGGIWVRTAE